MSPMKQTGSLLRETLELETAISGRIAEAEAHAQKAVEEAEREARLAVEAANSEVARYMESSTRRLGAETTSVRSDWKRRSTEAIDRMNRAFSLSADELARDIAERILGYDA